VKISSLQSLLVFRSLEKFITLFIIINSKFIDERVMLAVLVSNGHYTRVEYDTFSTTYRFHHFRYRNLFDAGFFFALSQFTNLCPS
jgi:hypothetical protein